MALASPKIVGVVDGAGRRFFLGDKVRFPRGEDLIEEAIVGLKDPSKTSNGGKILGIDGIDDIIWLAPDQVEMVNGENKQRGTS
mgnify:CR=1 FL=1